jgi:glycyl-tRNA synthetase beta chain
MSVPFLLEIGTEEIPDWMIVGALESLKSLALAAAPSLGEVKLDATPRRLVLRAESVPERQADQEELVQGPAKSAPPKAVEGFARKVGAKVEDLRVQSTGKGEYYTFVKKIEGRATRDILADALPGVIQKIYFPKTMYWTGRNGPRFIRPIRWIVALLGKEVVPFDIAGVVSGNVSAGHRRLGSNRIEVNVEDYELQLRANYVILPAEERRRRIENGIAELGVRIKPDPALLETLVYLTEYPTPIMGSFDPAFLELPEEVRTTVMRHHQRYFTAEGTHFVAVMNTSEDPEGLVRLGNERVLRARFNDARFFWETDQKKKLVDRVEDLGHVTFQAKLGSYLEKTERMVDLVRELGGDAAAERAARLAKCDLTTELVKEFTELQGVVGGLYARAQGEPEEVWRAIYEHYQPVGMEDAIPSTQTGQVVALADKVDTLCECFRIGMAPSGSKDPFALRRAAQGVVKILVEGGLRISLIDLAAEDAALLEFFQDRVRFYFRDVRGFQYDEVNAAMAAGWSDLPDLEARLVRLRAIRPTPDFEPLAASFKRIKNILRQAEYTGGDAPSPELLEAGPEKDLYQEAQGIAGRPIESVIAALRPKVDLFFDKVLVNAQDPQVRRNRLALLHNLLGEFKTFADFSEIVTSS